MQKGLFFGSMTRSRAPRFCATLLGKKRLCVSAVSTAAMQITKNVTMVMFSAKKRINSDKWWRFIGAPPLHNSEILYAAGGVECEGERRHVWP